MLAWPVVKKFTREDVIESRAEVVREIDALKASLAEKQDLLAAFDQILRGYFKDETEGALPSADAIDSARRFVGLSNSDAILQFLREKGDYCSPGAIKRGLLAGGITSNSPRFDTVVMNECRRLVQRGQVEKISDYGNFLYRLKPPGDEKP